MKPLKYALVAAPIGWAVGSCIGAVLGWVYARSLREV